MQQLEGFLVSVKNDYVCFLKKSLYGLKYFPRQWYKKSNSFMIPQYFKRCNYDNPIYFQKNRRWVIFCFALVCG